MKISQHGVKMNQSRDAAIAAWSQRRRDSVATTEAE